MRFAERRVVVVGGGAGLGRAIAHGFAKEGATVGVVGRTAETLEATVGDLPGDGHVTATGDVTDADGISAAIAQVAERLGGLDVAVNTAGTFTNGTAAQADPAAVARMLETNVLGTWLAMRAEVPIIEADGGGVIINFSSNIGAHRARPALGAYGASKAAVSAMTARPRSTTSTPGCASVRSHRGPPTPRCRSDRGRPVRTVTPGSPPRSRPGGSQRSTRSPRPPSTWPPTPLPTASAPTWSSTGARPPDPAHPVLSRVAGRPRPAARGLPPAGRARRDPGRRTGRRPARR